MRTYVALLTIAACLVFPCAKSAASTVTSSSVGTQKNSGITLQFKATPELSPAGSRARSRLFPVRDENDLLLTCIAPEIDKNTDADIFTDCALAPGRSQNDAMHSFVSVIHNEQNQRSKEQAKGDNGPETEPDLKATQK
jgi:hypothetical protein